MVVYRPCCVNEPPRIPAVPIGVFEPGKNYGMMEPVHQQGIFDVKGAVDLVSAELGVSRFTVYNYLRDLRNGEEADENNKR